MNTTTTLCQLCGAVLTSGLNHCPPCIDALLAQIRDTGDVLADLDTTIARLDRVAPADGGRRASTTPMPYNVGAATSARELRAAVHALGDGRVDRSDIARFRAARADALRQVDIPDPALYIGNCDCGTAIYARSDTAVATCRTCRTQYPAEAPDAWTELRRLAGPVHKLREWLLALGVTRSRAQMFRDVAQLQPVDDTNPRTYRLADVLDVVATARTRRAGA